jgi:DNA-binding MarR family transcriptional regulator
MAEFTKADDESLSDGDIGFLMALGDGGRSHQISQRFMFWITTDQVRSKMNKLVLRGLVERSERYSAVNSIFWMPTDKARAALSRAGA